jgi:hypothetical protein
MRRVALHAADLAVTTSPHMWSGEAGATPRQRGTSPREALGSEVLVHVRVNARAASLVQVYAADALAYSTDPSQCAELQGASVASRETLADRPQREPAKSRLGRTGRPGGDGRASQS